MNELPLIGLYNGISLTSKLIKFQTRGDYSHVGLHFNDYVIEAWATRFIPMRGSVMKCALGENHTAGTAIDLFRIRDAANIPEASIILANKFLHAQVGKPYDFRMVAGFVTRRQVESRSSGEKWFCSELAYAYLDHLGIDLFARTKPFEVSPDAMKRLPALIYVGTVVPKRNKNG